MDKVDFSPLARWMGWSDNAIDEMIEHNDWCAWRQVEKAIMNDMDLFRQVTSAVVQIVGATARGQHSAEAYALADLRTRCLAALKSSRSSSQSQR